VAGETNVRRLEKMGDIYGTSRVDTYKIAETLAGAMVGKSEEQIQMLAGSIQALRALGFKPGEAAGKLKSNEAALRQAFSDPAKAAQRVLREETGRTTPLEEVRKRIVEGASSVEFQQEVLRTKAENAPAPSQKQTRLQTMLAEQASTERQFPGITEAAKKRGELQTKSIVAAREFREAAGFQEDLTNLPAWLTWTGVLYGSKVNRLKGESEAAKSELEGFDKATKQTAPYLTPQVLKAFEENTRAIEILTRSLNTNSDKTAENTSAQGQGMSK
jgi:hypothetical protein